MLLTEFYVFPFLHLNDIFPSFLKLLDFWVVCPSSGSGRGGDSVASVRAVLLRSLSSL